MEPKPEMTGWSNERELQLLELYRGEPILWHARHPKRKDRTLVRAAWVRLSEAMDAPVADIRRKKESLMATYRMHRRKLRASEVACATADGDELYKPIWFAFKLMHSFLGGRQTAKSGAALAVATSSTGGSTYNNDDLALNDDNDDDQQHSGSDMDISNGQTLPESHQRTSSMSRRRKDPPELLRAGRHMSDALNTLNEVLLRQGSKRQQDEHHQEDDDCDLYGRMLAKKLRRLSELERLKFMHEIDGLFIQQMTEDVPVERPEMQPEAQTHTQTQTQAQTQMQMPLAISMGAPQPNVEQAQSSLGGQQLGPAMVQCANLNLPIYATHPGSTLPHTIMLNGTQVFDEKNNVKIIIHEG